MGFKYELLEHLDPQRHVFVGGNHDKYEVERRELDLDDERVLDPRSRYTIVRKGERFYLDDSLYFNINTRAYLPDTEEDGVYEYARMPEHYLGDFGVWDIPDFERNLFFVRGAWSIDQRLRINQGYSWYPKEQLSPEECTAALELYEKEKPDFVVTHAAPMSVVNQLNLHYTGGRPIPNATNKLLEIMFQTHAPKLWVFGHYHQVFDRMVGGTHFVCLDMFPPRGVVC
jgi:hypothetical protein